MNTSALLSLSSLPSDFSFHIQFPEIPTVENSIGQPTTYFPVTRIYHYSCRFLHYSVFTFRLLELIEKFSSFCALDENQLNNRCHMWYMLCIHSLLCMHTLNKSKPGILSLTSLISWLDDLDLARSHHRLVRVIRSIQATTHAVSSILLVFYRCSCFARGANNGK